MSTRPLLLLFSLLALVPTRARSAEPMASQRPDVTVDAEAFISSLSKEDYAAAVGRFDATMKSAFPAPKLKQVWEGLQQQCGKFQRTAGTQSVDEAGYRIVFVLCQFERAALQARVVFDRKNQIGGLFFTPVQSPTAKTSRTAPPKGVVEREVTVGSGTWALPGTLALPEPAGEKPLAAIVLVHGSGPHDRDETIGPNTPFRDLAWGLAAKGIAVLRYDKRTKVHAAKLGSIQGFTAKDEVVDDAVAAVRLLRATKGIDPARVYVLGHSLGGTLAPRIADAELNVAGLILLAGSTRRLEDAIVEQTQYMLQLDGDFSDEDKANLAELRKQADRVKALTPADAQSDTLLFGAPPSYWLDLRSYDPVATAARLAKPMLILQGARDYQVVESEFETWKRGLPKATAKLYPNLNHLFMSGEGKPNPAEYDRPAHVDPAVIADVAAWVAAQPTPAQRRD